MGEEWTANQFAAEALAGTPAASVRAYPAGDGQEIVVYVSAVAEADLDPGVVYAEVATDAALRAGAGQAIVSMTAMPIRSKRTLISVRETEVAAQFAVAVLYRIG